MIPADARLGDCAGMRVSLACTRKELVFSFYFSLKLLGWFDRDIS